MLRSKRSPEMEREFLLEIDGGLTCARAHLGSRRLPNT
jgi:hypothetical protein